MDEIQSNVAVSAAGPSELMAQVSKLFAEVQAVKMLSLRYVVQPSGPEEAGADGDGLKHGQMVLKSIEIQLRIIAEQLKGMGGVELPRELGVIWEAISGASRLKPVIGRGAVLSEIIAGLREKAAACAPAGPEGPGPAEDGETGDDAGAIQ
ncbi:MAG TPA: hypothetical protein VM658_14525 [bacterium]|nr:hypothetical protein [bacterium]